MPVVLAWLALAAGLGAVPATAAGPEAAQVVLLALRGYDPVTYFLPEGPKAGSARFELVWGGRVWRFVAEANRAAFQRDPAVYAPRLGGFDAAGVLDRRLVEADLSLYAILGQRLYLFRNAERRARFLAEPGLAASAEAIWPGLVTLLDDPPEPTRAGRRGGPRDAPR